MMLSSRQCLIRKAVLLVVIAVTSASPAFFIRLNEPSFELNLFKLLAKTGSLCGTLLLFWQFLLGFRQATARWVTSDYLWVIQLHRRVGIFAVCLIALHPVFIIPYYQIHPDFPALLGAWPEPLNWFVPLGILAFVLLLLIALSSTVLRSRLSQRVWYSLHLSSYAVLPLAYVHAFPIGMTLQETALSGLWLILFVLTGLFFVFRILSRFGVFDSRYEVVQVVPQGTDTVEITMQPLCRPLRPGSAQFAFFRRGLLSPARPFTVSKYDAESGELGITVKAMGRISGQLQTVEPGERFWVDGSYGVFGREAFETSRPIVMLAGGIGVTPFRRMIAELEALPDRKAYLFYGNPQETDIAHRREIEDAEEVDVIHVLSGTPQHEKFETGQITIDLIQKYLDERLVDGEYFLCGPPPMIKKLEAALQEHGVPGEQIHHELFSY
jgi:predicted ferric reductase